ncbi:MAG: nucleoside triphosphate pyrophosphohydrolase [Spirochaetes bacterium GWF1_31_7]|nr:MAG: nucleoside triphosphate pyrophosphohydrolase [Spirochaetes bacterium GWE1_32_154]OHD47121.1 MAG: nucleoside triphosphate pyrophosphohydrolase [Spirochaetes bacterium GWE2_31_10]OHD48462.1 MAG: nucleoside triphosphate pyrophosphohydrolase [Spirochaetes bacterium GWF1_31_7]OHD79811.1 MAG: nucleoside triphosphate pyrophosphohydrolase [Spirochaetes bacterium RIFOXYB1_FULL_32_8]
MKTFEDLKNIVIKLRSPEGCPWDRKQTHDSLLPFLFEESNEVADTIISKDYNHLKEELGDILLHILLHSKIAEENKNFTIDDVINDISEKLIRRHPHVFGEIKAETADEVNIIWENVKNEERKKTVALSILDKIPNTFHPLLRSYKLQKEASKVGFDWKDYLPVLDKVHEELEEIKEAIQSDNIENIEHELGDLLFSTVNLGRFFDVNSDVALTKCNKRFYERFRLVEKQVLQSGKSFNDFSLEELDLFWDKAKALLKKYPFEKALTIEE